MQGVTLPVARERAAECRRLLTAGGNPREWRREKKAPTFEVFAEEVIASLESGWRNVKHKGQWRSTITNYCKPIASRPVDTITADHVLAVLKPLWQTKPETAARVRGRIEKILDAARAKGHREGENPARWRGHLDSYLPKRQHLTRGHHAAMPWTEVPSFMAELKCRPEIAARALEFTILTAARAGEALCAVWNEFDLEARVWTVPAKRMKAGREHRVPLTEQACNIIRQMATANGRCRRGRRS